MFSSSVAAEIVIGGAGVGEAAATGVSSVCREHPASRQKQATRRVRAIFFIMTRQQEAWATRALEDEHFLRRRRIGDSGVGKIALRGSRPNSDHRQGLGDGDGDGTGTGFSAIGCAGFAVRSMARARSWAAASFLRFSASVNWPEGREHPAPRHKQATSRVKAIFFIMVKQAEASGRWRLMTSDFSARCARLRLPPLHKATAGQGLRRGRQGRG
jgi:hypothetical protein